MNITLPEEITLLYYAQNRAKLKKEAAWYEDLFGETDARRVFLAILGKNKNDAEAKAKAEEIIYRADHLPKYLNPPPLLTSFRKKK